MKKMKKLLPLLMAACLPLGGLTACGDAGQGGSTPADNSAPGSASQEESSAGEAEGSAESSTESQEAASGDIVNIDWFLSTGRVPSTWDQNQYVMKTITEKTGVTIAANTPAQDADTKLNLMIVDGSLPDLITITNGTLIKDLIDADLVWDMQELFETYVPDSPIINGQFHEDIKNALTARDGGWYAFPSHILSADNLEIWGLNDATRQRWLDAEYRSNNGVIFNRDLMEKAGVKEEDLQTESGLLEALEKVKNANLEVDGGAVIPLLCNGNNYQGSGWRSDGGAVGTFTAMFGGMPVDAEGNYRSLYYTDEFKHAVKFLNTCAQRGYVNANDFTMDRAAFEAACRSGRVFCFAGNTADTGFFDTDVNGFDFYTPGPVFSDDGKSPVLGKNNKVGTGWLQTFVSKKSDKAEACAKFLDFMASEEGLKLWNYGEEGVDYEYTADGLIKRTEEGTKKATDDSVTGVGAFWAFCNQNFDRKYMDPSTDKGVEPQSAYGANEKTVKYDSTALANLPGAYVESDTAMNNIATAVENYASTTLVRIILDAKDDDFDQLYSDFMAQLEKLELPKLDAYINEAVQENYTTYGYEKPLTPVN